MSNVTGPSGPPQFTPSSPESSGSRHSGVTPDGRTVSLPSPLTPIDPRKLTGLKGGEKQDGKSPLRKDEAKALTADAAYRKFRSDTRNGYMQLKADADTQLGKLASASATGPKLLSELVAQAQYLHNTYVNPVGDNPLPLPPVVTGPLEAHWAALTDLRRNVASPRHAGMMNGENRARLATLHEGLTKAVASLKEFAVAEMDEATILARYRARSPEGADLHRLLTDPRQAKRLESLNALCKRTFNEENISFLLKFLSVQSTDESTRISGYRALFDEFIVGGSKNMVNISSELRNEATAAFAQLSADGKGESAGAGPTTAPTVLQVVEAQMDAVHREVFDLMLNNSYADFRKAERDEKAS